MKKVLLVGTGDVGKHILEFAARDDSNIDWIVGDVEEERARWACNNAEIGAVHHGKHPKFNPIQIDLFDVERTTELIKLEKPDAIVNCTVLHPL